MSLSPKRPGRGELGWFVLLACLLVDAALVRAGEPTDLEQYLIELVNAARAAPAAEASRLGIDLNEGLSSGRLSPEARPPLAINPLLGAAARDHSQWMLAADVFSHTGQGGSSAPERVKEAGYSYRYTGENIAWRGTSGVLTPSRTERFALLVHDQLFESPGHRENMLQSRYREIGLGVLSGVFSSSRDWNAVMVTESFGLAGGDFFVTGVVYDDVDEDGFYSPGEGQGGVTVVAIAHADSRAFQVQTWASGGYSLRLPDGRYDILAQGGGLDYVGVAGAVEVDAANVKVDFAPEPAAAVQGTAVLLLVAAMRRRAASAVDFSACEIST